MKFVLALDQGTTSSRAILFDHSGSIVGVAQKELTQHYPQAGWVEHDALEIWQSQLEVAREVIENCGVSATDIAGLGIANQRETTVIWNRKTGEPVHRAIVWQDRRTAAYCDLLIQQGHEDRVREKSGLLINPYFCGTKIKWILDSHPDLRTKAEQGELAFGTVDSWLIWNLTGGQVHATDVTNASRTLLMHLENCKWDNGLLDLFEVPPPILPRIQPSSHIFGKSEPDLLGAPIPIGGVAGDQQAALFGQNCTRKGMAKNTYGTGCFMLMHIGNQPIRSKNRLLTTVACSISGQKDYALEGSIFSAGAVVQWLRDGLGIIDAASDIESLAGSVPDTDGVYMVPAFTGLGSPHWDSYARGTIVGITRGTTRAHIARAALEGIAFQVADVLDAMRRDAGTDIQELKVDGGGANNDLLMQFQADLLQASVVRPRIVETTAMGAAFLAGIAVGFWKDVNEVGQIWQADQTFHPFMPANEANKRHRRWSDALERSKGWETEK